MRRMIEVLIVVLILLTCGGLFGPAVVKVREAADRAECINNLRQLTLTIGNYQSQYSRFPTAAETNPDLPMEKRLSWIVAIYPFVEASDVWSRMDKKKAWDAEENRFAATEVLPKIVICPGCAALRTRDYVPTCYVGITGIGRDSLTLPLGEGRAGFFGYERTLKREDVKTRADSILMLVETSQVHGAWTAAGSPTTRGVIPDGSPYIGVGRQFGGNHRRGANVAFADGFVRFVEDNIDPAVWEAMATLSGKGNRE
jgi:prepilin-type processing-associated H-X9-DG protein